MFNIIAIVLVVALVAFLLYVAAKPDAFRIERSQRIQAGADAVFPLINDLHGFNRWNPFAQNDPTLQIVYSGPNAGVGAAYAWNGSGKSGAGRMDITQSTPHSRVGMQLEFSKPFAAKNQVEFTLAGEAGATTVTWTMSGRSAYVHKLMGTLFSMDKMVGGEFEKGLAGLKSLAEKPGPL